MSKISDLRKRAESTQELHDQLRQRKMEDIRKTVIDTVNSSSFDLTMLNHSENIGTNDELEKFASSVAEQVVKVATDPVTDFKNACHARGLKESKIIKAVDLINELFGLVDESVPYEEKLKAVAEYMQSNPKYYEDIALLY